MSIHIQAHEPDRQGIAGEDLMRVALLVGVLMVNMAMVVYRLSWQDLTGVSPDSSQVSSGQVKAMDGTWPPPPTPPSFP